MIHATESHGPLAADQRVELSSLEDGETLPLVIRPRSADQELIPWTADACPGIEQALLERGGVLLRGFRLGGIPEFEKLIHALSDEVLEYTYRSTPRSEVSGKVYTSTEYPAAESIPMHNEMSYTKRWPRKIWFYSVVVARRGGETPIADSRKVYREIDPEVRERFARQGVTYVRNYGGGMDLDWQTVFQTSERSEVEAFCERAGIEYRWLGRAGLQTRETCQGVARHPTTREMIWFNQAHLFHVSSFKPEVREFLLEEFGEEGLPRNAYYGDGSSIEAEVLDHVRDVLANTRVVFPWQEGDVLMLDNMLVAHGRRPFKGPRKVVVGMAEAWSVADSQGDAAASEAD